MLSIFIKTVLPFPASELNELELADLLVFVLFGLSTVVTKSPK